MSKQQKGSKPSPSGVKREAKSASPKTQRPKGRDGPRTSRTRGTVVRRSPPQDIPKRKSLSAAARGGSLGNRVGVSAPLMPRSAPKSSGHTRRFSDTTFLETITLPTGTPVAGQVVWSRRNLVSIPGTYLEVEAAQFNRWRIHKYRFRLVPVQGTTFAGMLLGAIDPDPVSVYDTVPTNIQRLSVLPGRDMKQMTQGLDFSHPGIRDKTDLFVSDLNPSTTDFTDRFSSAGNSIIAIVAPGDITGGTTIGALFLDYDIEFYDPHLSQVSLSSTNGWQYDLASLIIAAARTGGVGVLDWMLTRVGMVPFTTGVADSASSILSMFFDWVPWLAGDGSRIPDGALGFVRGKLGAAPTERPGLRPGRYVAKFNYASNTLGSTTSGEFTDPSIPSAYNGPILLSSVGYVAVGDVTVIRTISPGRLQGFTPIGGIYPRTVIYDGTDYYNYLTMEFEFWVNTGRGALDFTWSKNPAWAGPLSDSVFWIEITNKGQTSVISDSGSSVVRHIRRPDTSVPDEKKEDVLLRPAVFPPPLKTSERSLGDFVELITPPSTPAKTTVVVPRLGAAAARRPS